MNKIKPTEKQKRAFNLKREDPNKSYKDVMVEAGFKGTSVINPKQNLVETRGYQQLLNDYRQKLIDKGLDEDFIAKKLRKLSDSENEDIQIKAIDRVIEGIGLKAKEKEGDTINNTLIYQSLGDTELNIQLNQLLQDVKELSK